MVVSITDPNMMENLASTYDKLLASTRFQVSNDASSCPTSSFSVIHYKDYDWTEPSDPTVDDLLSCKIEIEMANCPNLDLLNETLTARASISVVKEISKILFLPWNAIMNGKKTTRLSGQLFSSTQNHFPHNRWISQ